MFTKEELKEAVLRGVKANGGKAKVAQVAKYIWDEHSKELEASGDRFYTWQYEMRWAANVLRHEGKLLPVDDTPRGVWALP